MILFPDQTAEVIPTGGLVREMFPPKRPQNIWFILHGTNIEVPRFVTTVFQGVPGFPQGIQGARFLSVEIMAGGNVPTPTRRHVFFRYPPVN